MKESFLNKLNNRDYISTYLYQIAQKESPSSIPPHFNISSYNDIIIENKYQKYKSYFENMYRDIDESIHLDQDQIKAILAEEDYSLIIAGAGTGKTTTMASKVKYLVDIKKVDPSKIAVMSFTRKATEELEKRIVIDFGIPAVVTTFHSLGMMHIREIFKNRKCYVVDNNTKNNIFLSYFKENIFPYKDKVKELLEIFNINNTHQSWFFGTYFTENYDKYKSFDEYFQSYKTYKIKEAQRSHRGIKGTLEEILDKDLNREVIHTIQGELVKSKGEAQIANFLFCNNIEYHYEKIYEELMPENRTYKPDFTLSLNGEEVYIEYFGLSTYPDGELSKRYQKIRQSKEAYHASHHTKFIEIDSRPNESVSETLRRELIKMGFVLRPKTPEEIYDAILSSNPTSQFYPFRDFLYHQIEVLKSSSERRNYQNIIAKYINTLSHNEKEMSIKQYNYINDFYLYYQDKLYGSELYGFDFSDMLYYANLYMDTIQKDNKLNFEYLVIDEYQDISEMRYLLAKNIASRNHAKVVAVGDDWQSIYAFTGSKVEYTYHFQKYFPGAKLFHINKTYRNSQELINYSGNFIMKNPSQIKKNLISAKHLQNPIKFVLFEPETEYQALKRLILMIHNEHPARSIMILARTNKMIDACFDDPELKDSIGTKIEYAGYKDIDIDGMTIHKAKGLSSDEVIIIGLDSSFPRSDNSRFWLEGLFKSKVVPEQIPFAEERRIFYVALTRSKNNVYLLVNKDPKMRSSFINELYNTICEVENKKKDREEVTNYN